MVRYWKRNGMRRAYNFMQNSAFRNMRVKITNFLLTQIVLLNVITLKTAFAEQACVKNSLGKVVCGELVPKKNSSTSSPSPEQKMTIKTQSGLSFTLNGCSKSRAGLSCSIAIYNSTDFDKVVAYNSYYGYSIIDSEGNEYKATSDSSIGNKSWGHTVLPPKLTIKSQLFFRPNGPLTNYGRILSLYPQIDNRNFNVTFRDFQIK